MLGYFFTIEVSNQLFSMTLCQFEWFIWKRFDGWFFLFLQDRCLPLGQQNWSCKIHWNGFFYFKIWEKTMTWKPHWIFSKLYLITDPKLAILVQESVRKIWNISSVLSTNLHTMGQLFYNSFFLFKKEGFFPLCEAMLGIKRWSSMLLTWNFFFTFN